MISAIQNSTVNTPKPQYNAVYSHANVNPSFSGKSGLVKPAKSGAKHFTNFVGSLPNTFEKFLYWLVGFKG